jgi:hypothetical protein
VSGAHDTARVRNLPGGLQSGCDHVGSTTLKSVKGGQYAAIAALEIISGSDYPLRRHSCIFEAQSPREVSAGLSLHPLAVFCFWSHRRVLSVELLVVALRKATDPCARRGVWLSSAAGADDGETKQIVTPECCRLFRSRATSRYRVASSVRDGM